MVENVSAKQAWEALRNDPAAELVDVRTDAEWNYVGIPDLRDLGKQPVLIAWQHFPSGALNGGFINEIAAAGLTPQHHIFFLCRSGVRSMAAAEAVQQAGYSAVFNIADGFEGPTDGQGHRGQRAGWKADGLPWRQG